MEDSPIYQAGLYKFFHTNDESKTFPAKKMGDGIVPLGCFYDPGDRLEAFRYRIRDSIIPFFQRLNSEILLNFKNVNIHYSGRICHDYVGKFQIRTLQEKMISNINQFGCDDFELIMNIDCVVEIPKDVILFGTQVLVLVDKVTWCDEEEIEEYPVWSYCIERYSTNLEQILKKEKMELMIAEIMTHLNSEYKYDTANKKCNKFS